jgi:hypothetical protein
VVSATGSRSVVVVSSTGSQSWGPSVILVVVRAPGNQLHEQLADRGKLYSVRKITGVQVASYVEGQLGRLAGVTAPSYVEG